MPGEHEDPRGQRAAGAKGGKLPVQRPQFRLDVRGSLFLTLQKRTSTSRVHPKISGSSPRDAASQVPWDAEEKEEEEGIRLPGHRCISQISAALKRQERERNRETLFITIPPIIRTNLTVNLLSRAGPINEPDSPRVLVRECAYLRQFSVDSIIHVHWQVSVDLSVWWCCVSKWCRMFYRWEDYPLGDRTSLWLTRKTTYSLIPYTMTMAVPFHRYFKTLKSTL